MTRQQAAALRARDAAVAEQQAAEAREFAAAEGDAETSARSRDEDLMAEARRVLRGEPTAEDEEEEEGREEEEPTPAPAPASASAQTAEAEAEQFILNTRPRTRAPRRRRGGLQRPG